MFDIVRNHDEGDAPGRFKCAANMLGLLQFTGSEWKAQGEARVGVDKLQVNELISARLKARKRKDFKESDRIRDELAAMGIALKDSKDPKTGEIVTTWEVAR
jgi:cysteinyl-tRNA synthetase